MAANRLPSPFERTRAVLGMLVETGLRAGEACRLDTDCIIAAQDAATGQTTYWLRVPTKKLHNDRVIPIRPALVEIVDAWMRKHGPQPVLWDERTNKQRDYLFTWHGAALGPTSLTDLIANPKKLTRSPDIATNCHLAVAAVAVIDNRGSEY